MAGKISKFPEEWEKITSDKKILDIVNFGFTLEFKTPPCSMCNRTEIQFNSTEQEIIDHLLQKFVQKNIIEEATHEDGAVISNIFVRPKPDGTHRLILNLSNLN